ncbi:TRAP transporter small permease subunit [Alloalcanivorax xenomutans]|jgi:TRAP-type mannitol/chloroaromatic compound transport system permease small subunit|uniref:TRAP transporter small permease subunit n=1 Tax=Alloalcanivorax xenomutans TaxID=1094342 RepID=UPI0003B8A83E|nr:TRAP transporter small permease subunit [Alloalcanivorax xenomutans]ERS13012.1 C4-dicarboxylate ABC transporter permease [Alcanivorax sp. PN-3]CUR46377.1 TRAP dicarboxylate transporter, DctQ subunit, unknown substrate 6 [Alloalcanivorax xenomutans]
MDGLLNRFVVKRLEPVVRTAGWVARATVLMLVVLVATNVLLRYVLSWSPVGMQEAEWHLVSPIALLGMAYAVYHRADVRVDFLYERFGPRTRGWVDLLASLLTLAVGALIATLAIPYVMQSYHTGEGSPDPGGLPYRYLLKVFIPLGFALLALQGLIDVLRAGARLFSRAAPEDSREPRP